MKNILEVNNISKAYRTYSSELWRILSWFGIKHKAIQETYTLRNINFSIKAGEAIGIIGQNGAGKSTLLKIITGTLHPTSGNVKVNGKIAAILELGMGFHPDLTGRQNAYHSAGLMGYTHEQIDTVISQIEDFAEIGEYFDQPVRLYSSGMQVRVAFAVATAFRPDILIIDEALSVGDAYFQHKCFDRIKNFAELGTSLLFVSHDAIAIKSICSRALLIKSGAIHYEGTPENVLDYYNADYGNNTIRKSSIITGTRSGNGKLVIETVKLLRENEDKLSFVTMSKMEIEIVIRIKEEVGSFSVGIAIKDRVGNVMIGTNTDMLKRDICALDNSKKIIVRFKIPFLALGEGTYSLSVALHDNASHVVANYDWWDKASIFEVVKQHEDATVGLCSFPINVNYISS